MKAPRSVAHLATFFQIGSADDVPARHYEALEQEFVHLHGRLPDGYPADAADGDVREHAIRSAMHAGAHGALCLSGGGIRSASFALGVLQGLARRGLLGTFDFLSTVSGGGYTGAWLSSWLFHAQHEGHAPGSVFDELATNASDGAEPEPEPVRQLRDYSSYLDPRVGAFSVDVWTIFATVARNLLLNWLVLVPILAAALLVPRAYFAATLLGTQDWIDRDDLLWWSTVLLVTSIALLLVAMGYIAANLPSVGNRRGGQAAFIVGCFAPICVATGALTLYWAWSRTLDAAPVHARTVILLAAGGHFAIWLIVTIASPSRWRPMTLVAALVSGAAAGLGIWWFATAVFARPLARSGVFTLAAVPLILAILGAAGTLFVGIACSETSDEDREWWSRFGAWLLITIAVWLATSGVVFVGPVVAHVLLRRLDASVASPMLGKAIASLITAATGAIAARTSRASANATHTAGWRRLGFALAAPSFVALLLIGLSSVIVRLLVWLDALDIVPEYAHPRGGGLPEIGLLLAAFAAIGFVMGLVVAVNKFSLHGMYRSRLIRAFLGASRPAAHRHPNRFTGFDPRDNIYMRELAVTRRPLHIVNMTLNLVENRRLAWQERKAESFTVSPLAAGAGGLGYRPIDRYGGPIGMSLGTAITISGAAASPNMGYHSSPAVTFLLTLFNARLGAWLGNPGDAGRLTWRTSDPVLGAGPLLREMFGRTTDANPYVYLSDGGHFENLGLYEMVARRCRYIVVSDAGCDAVYAFEDLGNAIRKIRIDLGIPIEFEHGLAIDAAHAGHGNRHGALGRIRYSAVDGPVSDGVLIYLKATLSGDEPVDVMNYAVAHPDFPHETTANQWFGESQFESYRMLGLHTVESIAARYHADGAHAGLAGLAAVMATAVDTAAGPSSTLSL
jgi:hypothetical protein